MDLSVASCCVTTNVIYVRYKVPVSRLISAPPRQFPRACRPSACCSQLLFPTLKAFAPPGGGVPYSLLLERAAVCWPGAVR